MLVPQRLHLEGGQRVVPPLQPDAPSFISSLDELQLGDGLGILVDDPDGATWAQPAHRAGRSLPLVPGLQLAMWLGADGTSVEVAIEEIANAVIRILTWDTATQSFLGFNAALPPALNSLRTLNHGDAFWIEVDQAIAWEQPAP